MSNNLNSIILGKPNRTKSSNNRNGPNFNYNDK